MTEYLFNTVTDNIKLRITVHFTRDQTNKQNTKNQTNLQKSNSTIDAKMIYFS